MLLGIRTAPGTRTPPALTTVEPTVPLPRRTAPLLTVVRLDDAIEPFTISAPEFTVVVPVYVLTPESSSIPLPTFTSDPPVPPDAPPSAIVPLTSVDKLLPPTARAFEPRK